MKVVLSKGKEEVPPKIVTKEVVIEYEPQEVGKAQHIQIYVEDINKNMNEPVETFYIVETVKRTLEFTVATDQTAKYKIMRDNEVFTDGEVHYPE